jgi:hypothetical protein
MDQWWVIVLSATTAVVIAIAVGLFIWRPLRQSWRDAQLARYRKDFHRQRERLEAKFFQLASNSGRPRGLDWTGCDFDNDVIYARDRRSGEISAFVAVTISFEAIIGGGMEDVEAVGNLRAATAVFRVQQGRWSTDGRAIFNLNPTEAVEYFHDNLELVGHEVAAR